MNTGWKRMVRRVLFVIIGAVLLAFSIKVFVRTGELMPGGIAGLSVLIQRLVMRFLGVEIPYTAINIVLNSVPVYIGLRFIGKRFTLLSLLAIVVSSIAVDIIPVMVITYDPLLIVVFGGILYGLGISLCLISDATSGGTDFIAIYLSQKKGVESWNVILGFNVVLLLVAGYFFGWDKSLYSIIFQYISTQVLHLMDRSYQQQTLFILTTKAQEICDAIYRVSHHGATIMDAEGSHAHKDYKMIYSVVSGADSRGVIKTVKEIDPEAFVNSIRTTELRGNFYLRPKD